MVVTVPVALSLMLS